jgi:hypothetical protein
MSERFGRARAQYEWEQHMRDYHSPAGEPCPSWCDMNGPSFGFLSESELEAWFMERAGLKDPASPDLPEAPEDA